MNQQHSSYDPLKVLAGEDDWNDTTPNEKNNPSEPQNNPKPNPFKNLFKPDIGRKVYLNGITAAFLYDNDISASEVLQLIGQGQEGMKALAIRLYFKNIEFKDI